MASKSKVVEEIEDKEDEDIDEKMTMYTNRFKHFIRKNKPWKKNNDQISNEDSQRDYMKDFEKEFEKDKSIICYKCNKPSHIKKDCPIAKKFSKFLKKKKGKVMKAT